MFPEVHNNIYPKSRENVEAILNYYFKDSKTDIEFLFENNLSINQIEYIARKVSENIGFFKSHLGVQGLKVQNLMNYGISALTLAESNWVGSQNRKNIILEFKNLIK